MGNFLPLLVCKSLKGTLTQPFSLLQVYILSCTGDSLKKSNKQPQCHLDLNLEFKTANTVKI